MKSQEYEFCPGVDNCPADVRNCQMCELNKHTLDPYDSYRASFSGGYYTSEINHWHGSDGKEYYGYNRP